MGQRAPIPDILDASDKVYVADFQAWLNSRPRKPGGEYEYSHRQVVGYLEALHIELHQHNPGVKGSKLYFRFADLEERCEKAANEYRPHMASAQG